MSTVTVGIHGEISLPKDIRERHGIGPNTSLRILEIRSGILIIPFTDEPMSEDLSRELAEWQGLSASAWDSFSFEGNES